MAVNVRFGGDPESYMDPPGGSLEGASGLFAPGAGLIATVLDAIGVHRQVAKPPKDGNKKGESKKGGEENSGGASNAAPMTIPVVEEVQSMLEPSMPMNDWGKRFVDSLGPLTTIDPNLGI